MNINNHISLKSLVMEEMIKEINELPRLLFSRPSSKLFDINNPNDDFDYRPKVNRKLKKEVKRFIKIVKRSNSLASKRVNQPHQVFNMLDHINKSYQLSDDFIEETLRQCVIMQKRRKPYKSPRLYVVPGEFKYAPTLHSKSGKEFYTLAVKVYDFYTHGSSLQEDTSFTDTSETDDDAVYERGLIYCEAVPHGQQSFCKQDRSNFLFATEVCVNIINLPKYFNEEHQEDIFSKMEERNFNTYCNR